MMEISPLAPAADIEVALSNTPGVQVAVDCINGSNSLRHIEQDVNQRIAYLEQKSDDGLLVACRGPRPGQVHPICGLPEMTKQSIEADARPIMRQRACAKLAMLNTDSDPANRREDQTDAHFNPAL